MSITLFPLLAITKNTIYLEVYNIYISKMYNKQHIGREEDKWKYSIVKFFYYTRGPVHGEFLIFITLVIKNCLCNFSRAFFLSWSIYLNMVRKSELFQITLLYQRNNFGGRYSFNPTLIFFFFTFYLYSTQ